MAIEPTSLYHRAIRSLLSSDRCLIIGQKVSLTKRFVRNRFVVVIARIAVSTVQYEKCFIVASPRTPVLLRAVEMPSCLFLTAKRKFVA